MRLENVWNYVEIVSEYRFITSVRQRNRQETYRIL